MRKEADGNPGGAARQRAVAAPGAARSPCPSRARSAAAGPARRAAVAPRASAARAPARRCQRAPDGRFGRARAARGHRARRRRLERRGGARRLRRRAGRDRHGAQRAAELGDPAAGRLRCCCRRCWPRSTASSAPAAAACRSGAGWLWLGAAGRARSLLAWGGRARSASSARSRRRARRSWPARRRRRPAASLARSSALVVLARRRGFCCGRWLARRAGVRGSAAAGGAGGRHRRSCSCVLALASGSRTRTPRRCCARRARLAARSRAPGARLRGWRAALAALLAGLVPPLLVGALLRAGVRGAGRWSSLWSWFAAVAGGHSALGTAVVCALWSRPARRRWSSSCARAAGVAADAPPEPIHTRGPVHLRRARARSAGRSRRCAGDRARSCARLGGVLIVAGASCCRRRRRSPCSGRSRCRRSTRALQQGKLDDSSRSSTTQRTPPVEQRALRAPARSRAPARVRRARAATAARDAGRGGRADPRSPPSALDQRRRGRHGRREPAQGPGPLPATPLPGAPGRSRSPGTARPTARRSAGSTTLQPRRPDHGRDALRRASPTASSARAIVDADGHLGDRSACRYDRLVLSACHPLYSAAKRIVVFARARRPRARARSGSSGPSDRHRLDRPTRLDRCISGVAQRPPRQGRDDGAGGSDAQPHRASATAWTRTPSPRRSSPASKAGGTRQRRCSKPLQRLRARPRVDPSTPGSPSAPRRSR